MCKIRFSNLFILLFVLFFSNVFAQTTGKIVGVITDSDSKEPMAGVNVFLMDTRLGASTDLDGEFLILNVPPGTYNLEAQMIGYGTVRKEGVRVSVNRTVFVSVELSSSILEGEVITVTVDKVAIKKDQTSSIRNVSSEDIAILPVQTVEQIVQMQPGVVGSHFRGGRSSEASYMVDGVMVTESFNHENAMVEVNPHVVADMEIITGTFNAEYGNAMSGVVNVVTKEGGNKLTGSGSVNVGNYLTSHKDIFVGLEDADIRLQDYSLSLSGPIISDNLGFVVDSRYLSNLGHLNGIHRFNVNDYSNFSAYPGNYVSEANGDNSIVDLDDNEKLYFLGKLIFRPTNDIKTALIYTYNQTDDQNYNHNMLYNPYGVPSTNTKSHMAALHLSHMLGQNAFYEVKLSYNQYDLGNYLFEDPLDPRYVHDFYGSSQGSWFSTGGQSKNHTQRSEDRIGLKVDFNWQLHRSHSLKTGIDASEVTLHQQFYNIRNTYEGSDLEARFEIDPVTGKRTYPYYEPEIRSSQSIYTDEYTKKPLQFAAYIQDKMEFESMVVNFGLRFDYFDPRTVYPTDWRNPANQDYFQDESRMSTYPTVDPQYYLSPRLGLSYNLGGTALLRFSYGHFLQVPPLNYFYQNSNFRVTELGMIGNPLLKSQKTISYEVGLWLQLTQEMDFEVAVYYRDIYDLLSSKIIYTYSQIRYGLYDNKDYGSARGLELQYQYRSGYFTVNANYSLQYTRGVADTPEAAFNRAGQDQDPVNVLIPLEWDQRHTLNILAGYTTPKFGLSLFAAFFSGRPYSWQPITESPLALLNLLPNNETRPSRFTVDLQSHYNLFSISNVDVRLTLLVYNLFDHLNENIVNATTGRAYTGIIRPIDEITYKSDFSELNDTLQNPGMYSAPRSIQLGLGFTF